METSIVKQKKSIYTTRAERAGLCTRTTRTCRSMRERLKRAEKIHTAQITGHSSSSGRIYHLCRHRHLGRRGRRQQRSVGADAGVFCRVTLLRSPGAVSACCRCCCRWFCSRHDGWSDALGLLRACHVFSGGRWYRNARLTNALM